MATAFTALAYKDFAPRIRPASPLRALDPVEVVAPSVGFFRSLEYRDFAPCLRPAAPPKPLPAKQLRLPRDRFTHLKHRDFAPAIRRVKRYYDPDSPLVEDWRRQAACRGQGNTPKEIARWFPGPGGAQTGKIFCAVCPVARECGQFADKTGQEWGIWGGQIRHRRKKVEIV